MVNVQPDVNNNKRSCGEGIVTWLEKFTNLYIFLNEVGVDRKSKFKLFHCFRKRKCQFHYNVGEN